MKKTLFGLAHFVLAVLLSTTANGQNGDWYVVPVAVYTDDDGDRNIDDSIAGGQLSFGRAVTEHISLEGLLGYSDIKGFPGQKHREAGINVLGFANRDGAFSPYMLAGVGYLGTDLVNAGEENRPTGSIGAGFKWALGNGFLSIRAEHRARIAIERDNNLTDRITSLGLQFSFGDNTRTYFDSDRGGVANFWEQCPETAPGVVVDNIGCEIDRDGDSVVESADVCPNTRAGVPVDVFGCRRDDDRDSVADDKDQCLNTVARAVVDAYGCERDDGGY